MAAPDDLLTAPEAAEALGVHRDTTRRAAEGGDVDGARLIGKAWVATRAAWEQWFVHRRPAGRPSKQGGDSMRQFAVLWSDQGNDATLLGCYDTYLAAKQKAKGNRYSVCGLASDELLSAIAEKRTLWLQDAFTRPRTASDVVPAYRSEQVLAGHYHGQPVICEMDGEQIAEFAWAPHNAQDPLYCDRQPERREAILFVRDRQWVIEDYAWLPQDRTFALDWHR